MPRWLHSAIFQSIVIATLLIVSVFFATRPEYRQHGRGENYYSSPYAENESEEKILGFSPEWWTAIFTGVLSIFTIILAFSTIGLWIAGERQFRITTKIAARQAIQTRKSLALAAQSADAATKQAHISERAAHAQLRAWVVFDQMETLHLINGILGGHPVADGVGFRIIFRNRGKTPACNAGFRLACELIYNNGNIINIREGESDQDIRRAVIGPGIALGTAEVYLNDAQSQAFRDRQLRVRLACIVAYNDIIEPGETRRTKVVMIAVHHGGQRSSGDDIRGGVLHEAITYFDCDGQFIT